MFELFRLEADDQTRVLTTGLLALERTPQAAQHLEACMRAAHSLKGAARIIGFEPGVKVAHSMEELLVGAQRGAVRLQRPHIDELLRGADLLRRMAQLSVAAMSEGSLAAEAQAFQSTLAQVVAAVPPAALQEREAAEPPAKETATPNPAAAVPTSTSATAAPSTATGADDDRMLRVTAEHLDRLLRLAGESLVESRRLKQGVELSHRLYEAALACRMRPFGDGTHGLPRMVRDVARGLGKQARLEIIGASTPVDREMLERLEAPLGHLMRNAVDHGLESPDEREAAGKTRRRLRPHRSPSQRRPLLVVISDDGRGIDLDKIRTAVVQSGLATPDTAARLSESEATRIPVSAGLHDQRHRHGNLRPRRRPRRRAGHGAPGARLGARLHAAGPGHPLPAAAAADAVSGAHAARRYRRRAVRHSARAHRAYRRVSAS